MGISLGLVGLGGFGSCFADLFKSHPLVSRVALCDREPDRIKKFADKPEWKDKFHPRDAYDSLEAICQSDVDALVIITQPWLHAPQCLQALEAGKHVYSAVPIISIPDDEEILMWCDRLVNTCRKTGLSYMLGETTFYRPQTMFCRRKAAAGAFGNFIYAEGEYFHDVDSHECNLRDVEKARATGKAGQEGKAFMQAYRAKGILGGPMHYPTHSTSGPCCVMKAHALKATGYGYRNQNADPFFNGMAFSNETALFQMSNGSTVRICEFREVAGYPGLDSETFRVLGTSGMFCEDQWKENHRTAPFTAKPLTTQKLTVADMRDPLPPEVYDEFKKCSLESDVYGGHGGSHAYLVHEFVSAISERRQPAINIWEAARYMAMGVMA
ncbi:MAG: Gfo/Idh/MocA family oxidoreductase, partial [Verrucomicrobiota bacterium]